jgi:hypothetical protein
VTTGGPHTVLKGVVADAADPQHPPLAAPVSRGSGGTRGKLPLGAEAVVAAPRGAVDDEVGVVDGLTQADEKVEDVCVVVQDCAALDIPAWRF